MSKKFTLYNVVKFISVILVVFAHATRMYTPQGVFDPINDSKVLAHITEYIYTFHMPLFILISGAVFGACIEKGKYTNIPSFILNKAKRLLIPYFFIGIAYVSPTMCLLGLTNKGFIRYCIEDIGLSYNSRHLWYILALFFIFILAGLVKPLLIKSRTTRFIVLVGSFALYLIASKVPIEFQLSAACSYQFYFFIGVCINYEYVIIETAFKRLQYLFYVTPIVLVGKFFFNPNSITGLCYVFVGISMVLFFGFVITMCFERLTHTKIYKSITNNSFGIYLFHPMIIYVLYYFFEKMNVNAYLLCFGSTIVSIVVSIAITKVTRMLNLTFLIGETKKR